MNLELDITWPAGGALAQAYFGGESKAEAFYRHPYRKSDALADRLAVLDEWVTEARRARAADVLKAANPEAESRIDDWQRGAGVVVTTGQQPGLATGPLLAMNKALSAVALAEKWAGELGRPVLPVFWVASEDHDWEESYHTYLLSQTNEPTRLEATPAAEPGQRPLFRVGLSATERLASQVAELLPPNDFREACLAALRKAYPEGCSLPDGFEQLLREWLGPLGLLLVRADDPALKRASLDVLGAELERGGAFVSALQARAGAIEAAGYDLQVAVLDDALNLFAEGPGGARERLYVDATGIRFHTTGTILSMASLQEKIAEDPSILSPSVLLRPVVESAVFPVLAYVAGPGEAAYFAQTQPLFEAHGVPMPVIHPRISVTVIEPKIRKVLDKVGVSMTDLARPAHEWASEMARDEMPDAARAALGALKGEIGNRTGELLAAVKGIDPTLKGPIATARNTAFQALAEAEKKILQSIKREQQIVLDQVEKARNNLMPLGKPQERVLTPLQFVGRYGTGFFAYVLGQMRTALAPGGRLAPEPEQG